jgi:hypothetical protein
MTDLVEVLAGDRVDKYRRAALVLRTLGWLSICWAAMVSIWIWMGAKAGSNIWLWSTIGLFVAGVICLGIAGRIQAHAARLVDVPRAGDRDRTRVA